MLMVEKNCIGCGITFMPNKYRKAQKYCSHPCSLKYRCNKPKTGNRLNCINCGKKFYVPPSQMHSGRKYCSHECSGSAFKVQYYKEGSNRRITNGIVTREFVFKHKQKSCQCCGYNEHVECLEIHHIDENRLNNSLDNLAVLCVMCHKKYHKHILNKDQIMGIIEQAKKIVSNV